MPVNGNPTPPLVDGTRAVGSDGILSGYVFQSGILKPEHSNVLSYKYPQYYLTALLERLGAYEPVNRDVFSWNIQDRTRIGGTVTNLSGGTTATATFEVPEYVWDANNKGYLIVGDTIRLESGEIGRVVASRQGTTDTDAQQVDVVRVAGGNWSVALIADTFRFGHIASLFGEGSFGPEGRLYLPEEEDNRLSTLRRSIKITGDALTDRTWLGDGSAWYWTQEDIEMKEFARDRELAIMFGQRSDSAVLSSKGIWQYVLDSGIQNEFSSAQGVSEEDIQNHIKQLMIENASNEMTAICGADMMTDIQRALKDYHVAGGVSYGSFGNNTVGLDVETYKFLGKTIHFAYYELFDDPEVLPAPSTGPSSDKVSFSNASLWLDLGTDNSGKKLLSMKYKELDGIQRKFVHKTIPGMHSPSGQDGGMAANSFDGFEIQLLSQIGIEFRLPNRSGILKATS